MAFFEKRPPPPPKRSLRPKKPPMSRPKWPKTPKHDGLTSMENGPKTAKKPQKSHRNLPKCPFLAVSTFYFLFPSRSTMTFLLPATNQGVHRIFPASCLRFFSFLQKRNEVRQGSNAFLAKNPKTCRIFLQKFTKTLQKIAKFPKNGGGDWGTPEIFGPKKGQKFCKNGPPKAQKMRILAPSMSHFRKWDIWGPKNLKKGNRKLPPEKWPIGQIGAYGAHFFGTPTQHLSTPRHSEIRPFQKKVPTVHTFLKKVRKKVAH